SPYMDPPRESGSRIALELSLRRERSEMVSLSHLDHLAGRCPGLDQFRRQLAAARALDPPERDEPGQWAEFFSDWLRAFNWPGARPPDSREHQVLGAWRELLSRFAALGAIQDRWTLPDALRQLAAMASHRVLQFHDDRAPVQIMGATEAAGLWFDRLWLADMSDTAWPPPAQPDPFIPVPVQKAAGMPEASAANMLDHTRTRTAGLLSAATRIVVSSAAEAPDSHQSLSPLFVDCESGEPGEPGGQAAYAGRAAQLYGTQAALETIADDQAPPLADVQLQGGVGPIADQASCPFRALAHHRLAAGALDEAAPGLDARERGSLLHDALKRLWDRLGDQQALAALDQEALESITAEAAAGALTGMFVDSRFRQRILDIERGRLTRLLREWLTVEMQRPWFRVVGTEVEMLVELAGVSFRVRADRVDELADGRRLIIDYKTGRLAGTRSWTQARITEPQLPMYALGLEGEVAALALAGVRRGECALRGIADGDDVLPSLAAVQDLELPDMASLRTHWASALARLAQGFRQGDARVDPIDADACRLCDVHALCRIFERGGSAR
ncbi:MAG TPA: PD-(D/E)XK nuclease family protein, partial [Arenicellales bacterium]|nr:PD-(D/E)XK nuclease family protein [Arenicellales bacterium]